MADHKASQDEVQPLQQEQDDTEYPSTKKILPVMGAVWLAFFVVALVRLTHEKLALTTANRLLGSDYHRYCRPNHLKRVQQLRGHKLVRIWLPPPIVCSAAFIWPHLHLLLD